MFLLFVGIVFYIVRLVVSFFFDFKLCVDVISKEFSFLLFFCKMLNFMYVDYLRVFFYSFFKFRGVLSFGDLLLLRCVRIDIVLF